MPRPVAVRVSYRTDAAYLLRLEEAIEKDARQSVEWRKNAKDLARKLSQMLLAAVQVRAVKS
jgi:hypothetical protein